MHLEILVEDISGKRMLDVLVPKIIDCTQHTFRVIPYKGIGRIPKNLKSSGNANKRILLDQLPRLLKGYGLTFAKSSIPTAVVLVCDLDDKCLKAFRRELHKVLDSCRPQPKTRFCFAIEEGEAWLLGDMTAIKKAYPRAKHKILEMYENDSICGTWEHLADAVFPGGAKELSSKGWQPIGREKSLWAEKITPHMDVDNNASPSFRYFRSKLRELTEQSH